MEFLILVGVVAFALFTPSSIQSKPLEHQSAFLFGERFKAKK